MGGLGVRLFAAHAAVVLVGVTTMLLAAHLTGPTFFDRHLSGMLADPSMAGMAEMMARSGMGGMEGMGGAAGVSGPAGAADSVFAQTFRTALLQALAVGAAAAIVAAGAASALIATRIVGPIRRLAAGSQRLAAGHYAERVPEGMPGELAELAASFNEMAGALESTERRRLELIGDVAHELRTPVATLQGYLEGLLDGVVQPSEQTWARLHDEAGRLRRLIDDLQELSRADARQMPLRLADVPAADIVATAVDRVADAFEEKGVALAAEAPAGDALAVRADRDRAVQVLTNLLTNALRYTPAAGSVRVAMRVLSGHREEAVHARGAVEFAVSDTGIGIAPEHLPHVFERFYRVDRSRSRALGGSGIGLTIARALVEAMGGRIRAASPGPGEGATFSFSLPRAGHPPDRLAPRVVSGP